MPKSEIEYRARLGSSQREQILEYMNSLGKVEQISRTNYEFSGIERTKTLRLRDENGKVKLIAKTGKLEDEIRLEAVLSVAESLDDALTFLAILGYDSALKMIREVYEIETDQLNISVRDVIDPKSKERVDTLFELEVVDESFSEQESIRLLDEFFEEQQLTKLEGQAWIDWVKYNHENTSLEYKFSL